MLWINYTFLTLKIFVLTFFDKSFCVVTFSNFIKIFQVSSRIIHKKTAKIVYLLEN